MSEFISTKPMPIVIASSFVLEDLVIGRSILVKQRMFAAWRITCCRAKAKRCSACGVLLKFQAILMPAHGCLGTWSSLSSMVQSISLQLKWSRVSRKMSNSVADLNHVWRSIQSLLIFCKWSRRKKLESLWVHSSNGTDSGLTDNTPDSGPPLPSKGPVHRMFLPT